MESHHFGSLSDEELKALATDALAELQARAMKKNHNVVFTQTKDTLVCLEGGVPADRAGWFYLPFLAGLSKAFQPKKLDGRQVYAQSLPVNSILEIKNRKDGSIFERIKVGGGVNAVRKQEGGFFMSGNFTLAS